MKDRLSQMCEESCITRFRAAPSPVIPADRVVLSLGGKLPAGVDHAVFAAFARLDARLLETLQPSIVTFPLIGADCDATQVVERLASLGFSGVAMALAADLPDPEMVQRELQALAPDLRLWLVLDAL